MIQFIEVPRIKSVSKSEYPPLNRCAYLIVHACVPAAVPSSHTEVDKLIAALTEVLQQCPRLKEEADTE